MSLHYDPEWYAQAGPKLQAQGEVLPVGDVSTRRIRYAQLFVGHTYQLPNDIGVQLYLAKATDGHSVEIHHIFKKSDQLDSASSKTAAIFHVHGGGFISVHAKNVIPSLVPFVQQSGVPIFSVEYRWAPEFPYPTPVEDCWVGLNHLKANAESYGVDPSRIAIMGESAGGGLAAALAIVARDRKFSPPIAKQILLYPMLDDRTRTDHSGGLAVFHENDILTGWQAYLGDRYGSDEVPATAAPARLDVVSGLPELYLDVGQLDVFLPENLEYALKFLRAGVQTELHVYPGVIHAFQRWSPDSHVVKQAFVNRLRAIATIRSVGE